MTHAEMVSRAERWLLKTQGCGFALTELVSVAAQIPDAIGWKYGWSYLVECKVSRADFLADVKKRKHKWGKNSMGNDRYYMTLPGIIRKEDLPKNWGLLYVRERQVQVIQKPVSFVHPEIAVQERHILCSALRRVHLRGDLRKIYDHPGDGLAIGGGDGEKEKADPQGSQARKTIQFPGTCICTPVGEGK